MSNKIQPASTSDQPGTSRQSLKQAGFSILETLVVIAVISVIAGVVIPTVYTEFEKARLASCVSEIGGMQAVAFDLGDGRYIPTPDEFWNEGYPSAVEGEYYYIVDAEDHNKGHGNDLDFCDEDNPNADKFKGCPGFDVKFVVLCNHDHGTLAEYCFAVDGEPPTVVAKGSLDDPGYAAWLLQNNDDGSKKEGKTPKTQKK